MLAVHSSKMSVSMRRMFQACTVMSLLTLSLLPVIAEAQDVGSGSGMDLDAEMSVSVDASSAQVFTVISETPITDTEPTLVSSATGAAVPLLFTAMTVSASPSVSVDASPTQVMSETVVTDNIEPTPVSSATGIAASPLFTTMAASESPTPSVSPSTPLSTTDILPESVTVQIQTTSEATSSPSSSDQVEISTAPTFASPTIAVVSSSASELTLSTIEVAATNVPTTDGDTTTEQTTTMATTDAETTEQTTTMATTDATSTTDTEAGAQTTTTEETETASTTVSPGASKGLSTTEVLVIALAIVVFLILLFLVLICVFIGLLCRNKRKGQDSFKKEILNNWEIKDSPSHGGVHLMKIRTLDEVSSNAAEHDGGEPLNLAARRAKTKENEYELTDISEGRGAAANTLEERSPGAKAKENMASYFGIPVLQDDALSNTVTTFGVPAPANVTPPSSAGAAKSVDKEGKGAEAKKPAEARASTDIIKSGSNGSAVNQSERSLVTVEASGLKSTSGVVAESTPNVKDSVSTFTTFKLTPSTKETAESANIQGGGKVNGDAGSSQQKEIDKQPSLKILSMSPSKQRTKVDQGSLSSGDVDRALGGATGDLGLEVSTQL